MKKKPTLDGVRVKIERAVKHFTDAETMIDTFKEANRNRVGRERDPKTGELVYRLRIPQPLDAPRVSSIVGDAVHNLRSALDYIVWELALSMKNNPSRKCHFPIFWDPHEYICFGARKVEQIPPTAQTLVESLQPYYRPPPKEDALWLINDLDIRDKHHLLNLFQYALAVPSVSLGEGYINGEIAWPPRKQEFRDAKDGTVIYRFKGTMDMDIGTALDVTFEKTGPAGGEFVIPTLTRCINFVTQTVVPAFEPFFT